MSIIHAVVTERFFYVTSTKELRNARLHVQTVCRHTQIRFQWCRREPNREVWRRRLHGGFPHEVPTPNNQHPLARSHQKLRGRSAHPVGLGPASDLITRRRNSVFGHIARLFEDTPAHQALRCHVDLTLGHLPDQTATQGQQQHTTSWPVEKIHHSWSFGSDATVLDDYALTTTTTTHMVFGEHQSPRSYLEAGDFLHNRNSICDVKIHINVNFCLNFVRTQKTW